MYTENELCELLKTSGITALKCHVNCDDFNIVLHSTNINDIISYAVSNNIKYMFYFYRYYEKSDYFIDKSVLNDDFYSSNDEELLDDLFEIAKTEINEHNRKINNIDFKKPVILNLFCLHDASAISMKFYARGAKYLEETDAQKFIRELKQKYFALIEKQRADRLIEIDKQKTLLFPELKTILLNDPEFLKQTNQQARKIFMERFLKKPENERFKSIFAPYDFLDTELRCFVDQIYIEYKNAQRKN